MQGPEEWSSGTESREFSFTGRCSGVLLLRRSLLGSPPLSLLLLEEGQGWGGAVWSWGKVLGTESGERCSSAARWVTHPILADMVCASVVEVCKSWGQGLVAGFRD